MKTWQRTHHQICAIHDRERRFRCAVIKRKAVCLFNEEARVSEKFKFRAHSISNHIVPVCLPRNNAKSHCAWQKLFLHVGLLNFFYRVLSLLCALLKRNIWICLWKFKHVPIISKQTLCALQATRPYSHSDSHDGWHVKYEVFGA